MTPTAAEDALMAANALSAWFPGMADPLPGFVAAREARDARHLRLFLAALDARDWSEAAMIYASTRVHLDAVVGMHLDAGRVTLTVRTGAEVRAKQWPLVWQDQCPMPWKGCPDGMLPLLLACFGEAGEMLDAILPAALDDLPAEYRRTGEPYSEEAREEMLLAMRDTWGAGL